MLKFRYLFLIAVLLSPLPLFAQGVLQAGSDGDSSRSQLPDAYSLPKWEPHLSVTTGFTGSSYGDNRLYTTIAPSITFRPTKRLSFTGGISFTGDMGLDPNYAANPGRSLAPRRDRNGGTGVASAHIEAEYQVNDRLWLAASLYHMGGQYAPFFGPANGTSFDVSATALSAAAAYRFSNDNYLYLSFTFVRDHTGMMPYLFYDTWMRQGYGYWGCYTSPTDYYRMMASPFYYGSCY